MSLEQMESSPAAVTSIQQDDMIISNAQSLMSNINDKDKFLTASNGNSKEKLYN